MTLLHVAFGTLALLIAPVALFARKGGTWHVRCGKAFVLSMAIVLLSAGFLWQAKGHLFLVPLGFVSAYLLYSGYRALVRQRRPRRDDIEDRVDMLAAVAAVAAGAGAAYLGLRPTSSLLVSIAPALMGIGFIGIAFAVNDLLGFGAPRMRKGWLLSHFSGMLAGYTSAVTAFIVINAHDVPMMVRWAVPICVGAAAIVALVLRTAPPRLANLRRAPRPLAAASRRPAAGAPRRDDLVAR